MPNVGNRRMMGGRRFTQVSTGSNKRDAQAKADNLRKRDFLARVTQEAGGVWYVWRGPKK